jgi:arginine exporter protein ArgO
VQKSLGPHRPRLPPYGHDPDQARTKGAIAVISDLLAGMFAGLAVAMPVGAIGTYLVSLASRERFAVAAGAALGVASVDGGYAIVAAVGGAGLQTAVQRFAGALAVVAALVLVAVAARTLQLAVKAFRDGTASAGRRAGRLTPARAYLSLVAMTAVNPATVVTFAAVVLGRGAGHKPAGWMTVALFALGAFAASAAWQLLLAGGGTVLGHLVSGRRGQLTIATCSAVIILGLAVAILLG